jgi:hypothetical protein
MIAFGLETLFLEILLFKLNLFFYSENLDLQQSSTLTFVAAIIFSVFLSMNIYTPFLILEFKTILTIL